MALTSNIACVWVFVFFFCLTKEIAACIAAWYRARNSSDSFSGGDAMYAQNSGSAMNLSSGVGGVAVADDAIEVQKSPPHRITVLLIIHHRLEEAAQLQDFARNAI
ncbi:Na+/alanine symporter [Variovorax paradoxus]|uniref:hypothetical protein n=1 Tax=Variovorax atrisoli TaxID=3394203 RepID=UPI0011AA4C13|nr:hypothetical protein [Variovorax paradoxus]MDR6521731.1 Na+/alanine symporter [Variovorax paradoxus]